MKIILTIAALIIGLIAGFFVGRKFPEHLTFREVAAIPQEWEINAAEWPLGEERVCVFFGGQNLAGCWERYDSLKGAYNRDDQPNDRTYLMKASLPENMKQALAAGHNQRVYCARDEYMHLSCPRGGSVE